MKISSISRLYHGTEKEFEHFDFKYANDFKDFGSGFYLTTNLKQAQKWAQQKANSRKRNITYIYEYGIEKVKFQEYKILELLEYDEKWLDFITKCRIYGRKTDYDIIYDKMADNRGYRISEILQGYDDNLIVADEAIEAIRWRMQSTDQYCFKTKKALSLLKDRKVIIQKKDKNGIWKIEKGKTGE